MTTNYICGHQPSVLKSHNWRTAENSASYLIPYLKPNMTVLDVGCGPGTITIGLAKYLPEGHIYGIDPSAEVIEQARATAEKQGVTNVTFEAGDVLDLPASKLPAGIKFDIVHAHQVLQHIPRALDAVKAMRDILLPGGYVALRCTDFETFVWWPPSKDLDTWKELFHKVSEADGCDQNAARKLVAYCMQAGFSRDQIKAGADSWYFSGPDDSRWWSDMWSERVTQSTFATKAVQHGFATKETLENISSAWKEWGAAEDNWFGILHAEVVCRVQQ